MIQLILTILGKARVNFAAERGIAIVDRARRAIYVEKKTRQQATTNGAELRGKTRLEKISTKAKQDRYIIFGRTQIQKCILYLIFELFKLYIK